MRIPHVIKAAGNTGDDSFRDILAPTASQDKQRPTTRGADCGFYELPSPFFLWNRQYEGNGLMLNKVQYSPSHIAGCQYTG